MPPVVVGMSARDCRPTCLSAPAPRQPEHQHAQQPRRQCAAEGSLAVVERRDGGVVAERHGGGDGHRIRVAAERAARILDPDRAGITPGRRVGVRCGRLGLRQQGAAVTEVEGVLDDRIAVGVAGRAGVERDRQRRVAGELVGGGAGDGRVVDRADVDGQGRVPRAIFPGLLAYNGPLVKGAWAIV